MGGNEKKNVEEDGDRYFKQSKKAQSCSSFYFLFLELVPKIDLEF